MREPNEAQDLGPSECINDNWMPQAQGKPEETRKKMDLFSRN